MHYKKLLYSLYTLLSINEKRRASLLILFTFFMALLEMVSVASILPFLSVLSDPSLIKNHFALLWMYDTLNFNINDDITLYLIFLGCISFFFYDCFDFV